MKKKITLFWSRIFSWPWMEGVIILTTALFFSMGASPVFAQGITITNTSGAVAALCSVLNFLFSVLIAVSVIMVIWAAYLYVTAEDDTEQITKAKKALFYAAMGIIAALFAKGFPTFVGGVFGISTHACEVVSSTIIPTQ